MAVILIKKKVAIADETFKKLSLWVIPVEIKGVNKILTYNLLLDTGAERTVLDPKVKEEVGIELKQGSKRSGGLIYQMADVDIEIASIPLGNFEVLIGRLRMGIDRYNIDGLLGADVLKNLKVELNYPERLLEISKTFVRW